jgi:hypothetical protein
MTMFACGFAAGRNLFFSRVDDGDNITLYLVKETKLTISIVEKAIEDIIGEQDFKCMTKIGVCNADMVRIAAWKAFANRIEIPACDIIRKVLFQLKDKGQIAFDEE